MSDSYTEFTPDDAAIVLVDHQPGVPVMAGSLPAEVVTRNAAALGRLAEEMRIPLVVTSTRENLDVLGTNLQAIQEAAPKAYENRIARETAGSAPYGAEPAVPCFGGTWMPGGVWARDCTSTGKTESWRAEKRRGDGVSGRIERTQRTACLPAAEPRRTVGPASREHTRSARPGRRHGWGCRPSLGPEPNGEQAGGRCDHDTSPPRASTCCSKYIPVGSRIGRYVEQRHSLK